MAGFMDVVEFEIGGSLYAMDISYAREIIEMTSITRLPRSPNYIAGIINLRGEILNVIDINSVLNLPASESREGQKIIVLLPDAYRGSNVGIIVDNVHSVLQITEDDVEGIGNGLIGTEFIKGVIKQKKEGGDKGEPLRLIIWLDIAAILEGIMGIKVKGAVQPLETVATSVTPSEVPGIPISEDFHETEEIETAVPVEFFDTEIYEPAAESAELTEETVQVTPEPLSLPDPIDEFLATGCRSADESAIVSAKDLFDAYIRWAEETGMEIMTKQKFGRALSKREMIRRSKDSKGLIIYRGIEILI
jgi:purine-binding chemotaxis protein CheW